MSVICVVSTNVSEEILLDLHEDKNGFAEYMKKMLALDLYKNKKSIVGILCHLCRNDERRICTISWHEWCFDIFRCFR